MDVKTGDLWAKKGFVTKIPFSFLPKRCIMILPERKKSGEICCAKKENGFCIIARNAEVSFAIILKQVQ